MHYNQIIAVLREHGFAEGRLIANSKSGYYKRHRSHFVVFNAQVCSLGGRVLKQADLDLTLDGEKLTQAARVAGENFYVLYENDPSPFWKPGSILMSPGPSGRGLVDADPSGGRGPLSPHEFWALGEKAGSIALQPGPLAKPASLLCGLGGKPGLGERSQPVRSGRSGVGTPAQGSQADGERRGFHRRNLQRPGSPGASCVLPPRRIAGLCLVQSRHRRPGDLV
jgi:hypothetical protein